jgi:hypothetical protein
MGYDDEKELDNANFGEVLAREVIRCVPKGKLFAICQTASGQPELDLERLVAACSMALPDCIGEAMGRLRWFNDACDDPDSQKLDLDELVDLVAERVASRLFGGDDDDDDD